jgi:Cu/Ag efflux protein CusF
MAGTMGGAKPGGMVAGQTTMTVTITEIDQDTPAVTVKTADGNSLSFRVQKKHYLKDVKVGDQVMITQTETLAVAVEAAK